MKPILTPAGAGEKLNVLGNPVVIRIHGRDTNGTISVIESYDPPGGGTPPHIHHREDETFQIIEGDFEFTVAAQKLTARVGDTVFAPRGIPHSYRNIGPQTGRLLCAITPAGFEGFFEEIHTLNPEQQQDIPRVIGLGRKYGLEFLPPPVA